jgi:tRNA dimethylallyltransferase
MGEGRVWLIAGPTASGKSELALRLAEATGAEIVNADSMQLYRDLCVLTARPGEADLGRAPHHLYGVADGAEAWSVGRWLRAATEVLVEIAGRGRDTIVVGGTGLYFRALTQGLAEIPAVPDAIRAAVEAEFASSGEADFRSALMALDPVAESRIAPGDRQRLVRAMAVARATGRSLTDWQAATGDPPVREFQAIVVDPPRAALYARCDVRLDRMVEQGALEEVRMLAERRLDPALPVMKALGVPEFLAHQRGETPLDQALTAARQSTRRYAKRQTTWFRNQTPDWPRIAEIESDAQWTALCAIHDLRHPDSPEGR